MMLNLTQKIDWQAGEKKTQSAGILKRELTCILAVDNARFGSFSWQKLMLNLAEPTENKC